MSLFFPSFTRLFFSQKDSLSGLTRCIYFSAQPPDALDSSISEELDPYELVRQILKNPKSALSVQATRLTMRPHFIYDRLAESIQELDLSGSMEDSRVALRRVFDLARLVRSSCFTVSIGDSLEQDQDYSTNLFGVDDVRPDLRVILQAIDAFLEIEEVYGLDGAIDFLKPRLVASDQLVDLIQKGEYDDHNPEHRQYAYTCRRNLSQLLSRALMDRVNFAVDDGKGFLNDGALAEVMRAELEEVFGESTASPDLSLLLTWRRHAIDVRMDPRLKPVLDGEEAPSPEDRANLVQTLLEQELVYHFEFMGGLRPGLADYEGDVRDWLEHQHVHLGAVGLGAFLREHQEVVLGVATQKLLQTREAYESAVQALNVDLLTKLGSRRRWDEFVQQRSHGEHERRKPEPYAEVMIDFSGFRRFNNEAVMNHPELGQISSHALGDLVLVEAARVMQNSVRPNDLVCRYGGEELCAFLEGDLSSDDVLAVLKRMDQGLAELSERLQIRYVDGRYGTDHFIRIGASYGVARSDGTDHLGKKREEADHALYFNKYADFLTGGTSDYRDYDDRIGVAFGPSFGEELEMSRYNLFRGVMEGPGEASDEVGSVMGRVKSAGRRVLGADSYENHPVMNRLRSVRDGVRGRIGLLKSRFMA